MSGAPAIRYQREWIQCHYCKHRAETSDHIVPARLVRALRLEGTHPLHETNRVPACKLCNQQKADKRSDCPCARCELAWNLYFEAGGPRLEEYEPTRVARIPGSHVLEDLLHPDLAQKLRSLYETSDEEGVLPA